MELIVILLVTLLVAPVVLLATGPIRIILGVVFLLFFPGYTLLAALFPRGDSMQRAERLSLSFVLSMALVILVALVVNFTPWGVSVEPILAVLAVLIFATSYVALYRRQRLPEGERFEPRLDPRLPRWDGLGTPAQRAMTAVLAVSLAGAIAALAWAASNPGAEEPFTDFYILGSEGLLMDYPREVTLGNQTDVTLGIVNHEGQNAAYDIEIVFGGEKTQELGPVSLADEEQWEERVDLVPSVSGDDQKVEFVLYKENEADPYLTLHLWLDVKEIE
jgi:uncharacterized membrane protein